MTPAATGAGEAATVAGPGEQAISDGRAGRVVRGLELAMRGRARTREIRRGEVRTWTRHA